MQGSVDGDHQVGRDHVHWSVLARASSRSCSGRLGFGAGAMAGERALRVDARLEK